MIVWLTAVLTGFIEGCAIGAIRVVLAVNCIGLIVYVVMVTYRYVQWRNLPASPGAQKET